MESDDFTLGSVENLSVKDRPKIPKSELLALKKVGLPLDCANVLIRSKLPILNIRALTIPATISRISSAICQLSHVGTITIESPSLSILPEYIGNLPDLGIINIRQANITQLPASLFYISSLDRVYIGSCPLQTIPWLFCRELGDLKPIEIQFFQTNTFDDRFHFSGESLTIWNQALENIKDIKFIDPNEEIDIDDDHPKYILNEEFCRQLRIIMGSLFADRMNVVIHKIQAASPLDPLDWTHPDFPKWAGVLDRICAQNPNETAKIVQQKLQAYNSIKISREKMLFM